MCSTPSQGTVTTQFTEFGWKPGRLWLFWWRASEFNTMPPVSLTIGRAHITWTLINLQIIEIIVKINFWGNSKIFKRLKIDPISLVSMRTWNKIWNLNFKSWQLVTAWVVTLLRNSSSFPDCVTAQQRYQIFWKSTNKVLRHFDPLWGFFPTDFNIPNADKSYGFNMKKFIILFSWKNKSAALQHDWKASKFS